MMHQYGNPDSEAWPIRADSSNIRASWWWTFSPLLVLDFFCLLALPSFFITLSRNGFVVAARRASQRSGVLSLFLLGNPCIMVSELVLISNLAVPDSRHISYTSFYVFAPCLIAAILLVLFAMAALFSTSSQSVKASTVSLFAGVCVLVFCIICPLRLGQQVAWSWWAIMCPMYVVCLVWASSAFTSLVRAAREQHHNPAMSPASSRGAASVLHSKWSTNCMLLIDSLCFGMFFLILAAVLDGWPPVSGNLRLAILPIYAATAFNCLTFIVSSASTFSPTWAVMVDNESLGSDASDTPSLSLSVSSGSSFVQESPWLRALHVTTLVLLAFQVQALGARVLRCSLDT
jgi:hypothetical protein